MLLGTVALFFVAVELYAAAAALMVPSLQILTLSLLILLQLAAITMLKLRLAKPVELIANEAIAMVRIIAKKESLKKNIKAK